MPGTSRGSTGRRFRTTRTTAKDSLVADNDPFGVGTFDGVARKYFSPIDLRGLGMLTAGSDLDLHVAFDMIEDHPGVGQFQSRSLRLVAFVQDLSTKEILQVREARVRLQ